LVFLFFGIYSSTIFAQINNISFEKLERAQLETAKNTLVFIHTDWCRYCQQMQQTTFKDSTVIDLIDNHFYFINFDAAQKADVVYKGHRFRFLPSGTNTGVHELAQELGTIDGTLNYPTLCIINEKDEVVFRYGGFLAASELNDFLLEFLNH